MSHLASWLRRRELYLEAEAQVARVVRESGAEATPHPNGPAYAADRWALRGVPAVGGKDWPGSAIPGTQPEAELLRRAERYGW